MTDLQAHPESAGLWQLFWTFFKIGAFTIGGGYAMIPLIEAEVVAKRRWLDREGFLELLALAQAAPGVIAMNIAVFVGYQIRKNKGVAVTTLGAVLPSFIIILMIAVFFASYQDNPVAMRIFKGIRPAVVALIAVPVINLSRTVRLNRKTVFIPIITVVLITLAHMNPVWTIVMAAVGGILWSEYRKTKKID
ncbi:MAG: chromate transporter [Bacteroidales bacterium]|jgi:chromate transporter|nr:chromate transporter [Bacteroidales bacterium]MDD4771604.1 chromate transporter [Bacteroidales bacterium]HKL93590.1 chromate transporter [Bacteroidales bacterium]